MINCPFDLVDGKLTCPQCDWVYPLRSDKPPKRNCPKSPEGRAGRLIAVLHEISSKHESEMKANGSWQMYPLRPLIDLEKYLEICLDCDQHNGNTCTTRGTDCRARGLWLKRLACVGFRDCPNWK